MSTDDLTPTQRQAIAIDTLQAELEIANERIYWLVAELAKAHSQLNNTDYKTVNL